MQNCVELLHKGSRSWHEKKAALRKKMSHGDLAAANRQAGLDALHIAMMHIDRGNTDIAARLIAKATKLCPGEENITRTAQLLETSQTIFSIIRDKAKNDLYGVLSCTSDASDRDIKRAYRARALRIHPDKCTHPKAAEAFSMLTFAHTELTDATKRAAYNKNRRIEEARALTSKQGCKFVEVLPPSHGAEDVFHVRCSTGHDYAITFDVLTRGGKCPICVRNDAELAEMRQLTQGIRCRVVNCRNTTAANTEYELRCASNHDFLCTLNMMRQGAKMMVATLCPICQEGLTHSRSWQKKVNPRATTLNSRARPAARAASSKSVNDTKSLAISSMQMKCMAALCSYAALSMTQTSRARCQTLNALTVNVLSNG